MMKYLLIALCIGAVAAVEFMHEKSSTDAPGAAICMAPHLQQEAVRDFLRLHVQSHR